jgi:hypothetical protein
VVSIPSEDTGQGGGDRRNNTATVAFAVRYECTTSLTGENDRFCICVMSMCSH